MLIAHTVLIAAIAAAAAPTPGTVPVDGGAIAYDTVGAGAPVVLLHGGLLDRRMWDDQLPALAGRYRVIRVDSRGHGASSAVDGPYSNVEDLHAVLTALGIDDVVLVGLSLGGRTALDFALAYPGTVRGVVAVSPGMSGYTFVDPILLERGPKIRAAAEADDIDGVVEWFQRSWTDGPRRTPEEVPADVRERVRTMALDTLRKHGSGPVREVGAADRLGEIRCPVVAVLGDLDMADIHTIVGRLAAEVPHVTVHVVEGAAHMVNMEKPAEFDRILLDALAAMTPRGNAADR